MKHSIFALPALLRPVLYLATAAQSTFSVHDDLLAFPQYEVKFSDDYVLESQAEARLRSNDQLSQSSGDEPPPSQIDHYRPSDLHASSHGKSGDDQKLEYEYMVLDNQPYLCSIPVVSKPLDENTAGVNATITKAEEEKELARATDRGWELLQGMQGNCIYYISGWWSYRFCYNDGVRQFHQLPPSRGVPNYPPLEDPGVEAYSLGLYKGEKEGMDGDGKETEGGREHEVQTVLDGSGLAKKTRSSSGSGELVQRGESRYLVQKLEGGTKCDLTGKPRRVEVQFHCNQHPFDRISLIKETSTCAYLMQIQTPRLCNDVAFLPPQKDSPNTISCSPILAEDQVEDYKRDISALKAAEREAKIWAADADAAKIFLGDANPNPNAAGMQQQQVVGDILIGAHAIVPPDLKLEKSAILGGGKETLVDTVASSDGKTLSKEDLDKFGLGDPKSMDRLRKKMEEMAQGQEWRLQVIETPRGLEYRGIIGKDEEEGEGEKKEGKGDGDEGEGEGQEGSQEEYFKEEL